MRDDSASAMMDTIVGHIEQVRKHHDGDLSASATIGLSHVEEADPLRSQTGSGVVISELLDKGGMGEIWRGRQESLQREVAVKRPLSTVAMASSAMFREAWIAAYLDHPNILPVHDLATDGEDPLLVMKLIDGVSWSSLLADPSLLGWTRDPLEQNLKILLELCRALRYTHARGLVHLDIKPDNIMVGRFDEVYLLDWGMAAAWRDDTPDWIPRVTDQEHLQGTPVYMAPEQARVALDSITPATDVYQLGGILYQLVTGQMPRSGTLLEVTVKAGFGEAPDMTPVPGLFRSVIERAMAPATEDRYPDAESFARALEGTLEHRSSERLADEGFSRLARVCADAETLSEHLVTECQFAFEQALTLWPDNLRAREGYDRLLHHVIGRDLKRDDPLTAQSRLMTVKSPPEALMSQVRDALAAREIEASQAAQLLRHHDPTISQNVRIRWVTLIGVVWFIWNTVLGWINREVEPISFAMMATISLVLCVIYALGCVLTRHMIAATQINRYVLVTMGMGLLTAPLYWFACIMLHLNQDQGVALQLLMYVMFGIVGVMHISVRLRFLPILLISVTLLGLIIPSIGFELSGFAGASCAFACVWAWRKDGPTGATLPRLQ